MTRRPLPKVVISVADEFLSGWLVWLANFNHCDLADLLAHVGIDGRYVDVLDLGFEDSAALRIAAVARTDFKFMQSLTITPATPLKATVAAQFPFQTCPVSSVVGLDFKHCLQAWAFECLMYGAQLIRTIPRPGVVKPSTKILRRVRIGARFSKGQ